MRKTYFIFLGLVTALSLLLTTPPFATIAILFTFGLALAIMYPLPYTLLVMWSYFPAVVFWERPLIRYGLLAAGTLMIAASLLGPPHMADQAFETDLQLREQVAPRPIRTQPPLGIEIHRHVIPHPDIYSSNGTSGAFYDNAPCFGLCEKLLSGPDVKWVRLVMRTRQKDGPAPLQFLLKEGTPAECQRLNPDFDGPTTCVLFAPDEGDPADLTLVLEEKLNRETAVESHYYRPFAFRKATAYEGHNLDAPVLFSFTQLFHKRPVGQVVFDTGSVSSGNAGGGFTFVRESIASDPIDLLAAVEALGLRLGPDQPAARRPQDAAYVASFIEVLPDPTQSRRLQIINDWHNKLRENNSLSNGEVTIFCSVMKRQRAEDPLWGNRLLQQHGIECD